MKINDSSLNLQSKHNYTEVYERKESLTITEHLIEKADDDDEEKKQGVRSRDRFEHGSLPGKRLGWYKNGKFGTAQTASIEEKAEPEYDGLSISDMKTRIMKMVLEEVTGKKIDVYNPDEEGKEDGENVPVEAVEGEVVPAGEPQMREVSLHYELNEMYYEQESLSFEAVGQVTTEDGRTISFSTSLSQSREIYEENHTSLKATGTLIDPIVINQDGRGAKLTDEKVNFDLTADGTDESISNLKDGSSFLALDRNGNGTIDDGSELFGPTSGNGFGELRELDSDNNGWIDENDELFYELRLWKPGEEATALLERGVGAISLDSVGGSFQLKDSEQLTQGVVREQGVWLHEQTGQAGIVQEIDLMA